MAKKKVEAKKEEMELNVPVDFVGEVTGTVSKGANEILPILRDFHNEELNELRNKINEKWTKREHQIKIFNNDFESIGFYIEHKNTKSIEFAEENKSRGYSSRFCDPLIRMQRRRKKKDAHIDENNEDLPEELRGKHYDAGWQICKDLGCNEFNRQSSIENHIESKKKRKKKEKDSNE